MLRDCSKTKLQKLSLDLVSIAGGTNKASEYPVFTDELRARKGVHANLKLAKGKSRFPGL